MNTGTSEERFITVYDNNGDSWYEQYFINDDDDEDTPVGAVDTFWSAYVIKN